MAKHGILLLFAALNAAFAVDAGAAEWGKRSRDLQNTGNAGYDPALQEWNVQDLQVVADYPTEGIVNATPVITEDGLLITGDWSGYVYVIDTTNGKRLVAMKTPSGGTPPQGGDPVSDVEKEFGPYIGMQSTPTLGEISATGERRVYFAINSSKSTLYCLSLTAIAAERQTLDADDGTRFVCGDMDAQGAPVWPKSLAAPGGSGTMNGSPMFSKAQHVKIAGQDQLRDVLYTPTTGVDCANGQFWALDARSGELLWSFDPVTGGNGNGGVIWTTPAMNLARTMVYVTTGDCVTQPQSGEKAESLVALDAADGHVVWFHQRRLVDTADLDIGTGPVVADVEDGFEPETPPCNVVVSTDKDGCMYAFQQEADIPGTDDAAYDPLRPGQQRLLWRQCYVPGSLNGGFNASNPAFDGRFVVQQTSGYPAGHVGIDDANAFSVNACTGHTQWASSTISNGRIDAAIASGMVFQVGNTRKGSPCRYAPTAPDCDDTSDEPPATGFEGTVRPPDTFTDYPYRFVHELQVVKSFSDLFIQPPLLATVDLATNERVWQPTLGGGGPAIVNGRIYIPTTTGILVVGIVRHSEVSCPVPRGNNFFFGPYAEPVAPNLGTAPPVDPGHPYYPSMLDTIQKEAKYRTTGSRPRHNCYVY